MGINIAQEFEFARSNQTGLNLTGMGATLTQAAERQGYTLVPLDVYLKDGRMKLTLGLCQGKHAHDKRASMAERDVKRDLARRVRTNSRGDGD